MLAVGLASAGFFMAVGALVGRWVERGEVLARGRLMAAAAALMLGVAAPRTLTVARNRVWENPVQLWEDAASKAPRTWMAVYGMADAYRAVGDNVSAAVAYQPGDCPSPHRNEGLPGPCPIVDRLGTQRIRKRGATRGDSTQTGGLRTPEWHWRSSRNRYFVTASRRRGFVAKCLN